MLNNFLLFSVHILFASPEVASNAIKQFTGKTFNDKPMFVCYSQSTFLLFVGNLPYDYTHAKFRTMMEPFGQIERIFIGEYLFVEAGDFSA